MRFFGALVIYISLAVAAVSAANVIDLTDKTFEKVVNGGVPTLVEFYASWCGHCKSLAPTYEELATIYAPKKDKIQIAKIDGDRNRKASRKYKIEGFPTIMYFDGKGGEPISYDKGRNLDSFVDFITAQTGLKGPSKPASPPSAVVMLTDADFKKIALDPNKDVLVAFTASWCGHCKAMAPAYETAAQIFANDENVVIAKMDTTDPAAKYTAKDYGVTGYPTFKFFPKGSSSVVDYQSGRSVENFVEFVNAHAGTHRTPDGGLDSKAGIDPEFTDIIYKLRDDVEGDIADVVAEAKAVADQSVKPFVKYYAKFIEKYSTKGDKYLKSEIKRLSNIIKKGTMNRTKADQFQMRFNILSDILAKLTEPLPPKIEKAVPKDVVEKPVEEVVEETMGEKDEL